MDRRGLHNLIVPSRRLTTVFLLPIILRSAHGGLPWQDSWFPNEDMICLWESSVKAKATEHLCWGGPLLDSVGMLPRLFDSLCFFVQQTVSTTMLQRLSSCFRVRLGPSVREQQPYCIVPVTRWGNWGGRISCETAPLLAHGIWQKSSRVGVVGPLHSRLRRFEKCCFQRQGARKTDKRAVGVVEVSKQSRAPPTMIAIARVAASISGQVDAHPIGPKHNPRGRWCVGHRSFRRS